MALHQIVQFNTKVPAVTAVRPMTETRVLGDHIVPAELEDGDGGVPAFGVVVLSAPNGIVGAGATVGLAADAGPQHMDATKGV